MQHPQIKLPNCTSKRLGWPMRLACRRFSAALQWKRRGQKPRSGLTVRKDATQVADKQAAEVTQKKFKGAELEEVPATTQQTTAKWVISIDK